MKFWYNNTLTVIIAIFAISANLMGQNRYDTLPFFNENLSTKQAEKEFVNAIVVKNEIAHEISSNIAFSYLQYAYDKKDSNLLRSAYYQVGLIYLQDTKYDSSIYCFTNSKKIAESLHDTLNLINIERALGGVYLSTKKNDKATENFKISLGLAKAVEDSLGMAKALNNLSLVSFKAANYDESLSYLKQALDLKIAFAPKFEQISTLINIGDNYSKLKSFDKALSYLNRAKKIAVEFNKQNKLALIWKHIANVYIDKGDYKLAAPAFHKSMNISRQLNDNANLNLTVKNYAEFLITQGNLSKAGDMLEAILPEMNEKQNPVLLTEIFYDLGKIAYENKNYIKAQVWLNQAVSITDVPNQNTLVKAYNLLSLISYLDGEYELAYHHLRISEMLDNQIKKQVSTDKLYELQVKYNSLNDKKSIEQLLEVTELKDKERQKSKFYFLITFLLFIITLAVAIALARQARIKHRQSAELKNQIEDNFNKTKDLIKAHKLAEEGLQVKSEFIAMVSHEIRTPMNAIIGMSSLLSDTELTDYQKNYLNNISISSNNLLVLLNDILDFSRVEAGKVSIKLQPSNLDKELKHVINMFEPLAQEKELSFTSDIDKKLPEICFIDAPRLRQVVVNLLSNAIKFTHSGFVKLTVMVTNSEPTLNGDMVTIRFMVEDSGIGVPQNKQSDIFSSFNQLDSKVSRQYSGVGLGLSISQGILGMMGTRIRLESEFAKGSKFWFDIKVKSDKNFKKVIQPPKTSKVKFDKELGITCPLRILVAEDNEINQKLIQINLNKMGYNPVIVSNGQEALDQIKIQEFDVVFMDVQMPVMDGVTATKELVRKYGKEKPVIIAVTANAMGTDKQSYIQAGMDDYISKPFTTKEIDICLRNWYIRIHS
tara:strand:+ start:128050 stop:130695 length:2646 start_codon:yes stop_codon:yes gene_type:complete